MSPNRADEEANSKSLPTEMNERVRRFARELFARDFSGQSQREIAKHFNLSQATISDLQSTKSQKGIGPVALVKLADYSGVLIDRIIGRTLVDFDVAVDYNRGRLYPQAVATVREQAKKGPPRAPAEWAKAVREVETSLAEEELRPVTRELAARIKERQTEGAPRRKTRASRS